MHRWSRRQILGSPIWWWTLYPTAGMCRKASPGPAVAPGLCRWQRTTSARASSSLAAITHALSCTLAVETCIAHKKIGWIPNTRTVSQKAFISTNNPVAYQRGESIWQCAPCLAVKEGSIVIDRGGCSPGPRKALLVPVGTNSFLTTQNWYIAGTVHMPLSTSDQ